jgi:hypothetical protein
MHDHNILVLELIPTGDRRKNEINNKGSQKGYIPVYGTPGKADVNFPLECFYKDSLPTGFI